MAATSKTLPPLPITSFAGPYRFLSNFYPSPVKVGPYTFPTAEHAFQAQKELTQEHFARIMSCGSPGQAKRAGRSAVLRFDWETARIQVMASVVREKFLQNKELADRLLSTGSAELVEMNNWGDTFWGVAEDGHGENWLGKILMIVRREIRIGQPVGDPELTRLANGLSKGQP